MLEKQVQVILQYCQMPSLYTNNGRRLPMSTHHFSLLQGALAQYPTERCQNNFHMVCISYSFMTLSFRIYHHKQWTDGSMNHQHLSDYTCHCFPKQRKCTNQNRYTPQRKYPSFATKSTHLSKLSTHLFHNLKSDFVNYFY